MVAVAAGRAAQSVYRTVRDVGTCYYLVTYIYNVDTGEVVRILSVRFQGCDDGGGAGDGGGGGDVAVNTPPNPGCGTAGQTAGKAYADIGAGNPVFNNPNPNSAAPQGTELYGYIYTNDAGGYRYDPPTSVNLTAARDTAVQPPGNYVGWRPIGLYHTHPHDPNGGTSQVDIITNNHFSPLDEETARSNGYPMYVAVLDTLNGNDPNENAIVRWYKFDPATGQETLVSSVGSGGC